MKKIIFKSLTLLNFKGVRALHVDFGEGLTIISGRNATGKTSIADAIMWVLFDTGYDGNKLEPKTYNKEGQIIKEIPHEVELTVKIFYDGTEPAGQDNIVLKRTLTDSWKGDECINTFKYYVNDEVVTAGEYKKTVDAICPEDVFRLCSSTKDFVYRPWQEQRNKLQTLVGDITTEDITEGNRKYDFVVEALKKQDIDKLVHHIKYKRKEVQEQLDAVPIRLEELNKSLPESQNWESLSNEKAQLNDKLVDLANKIQEIRTGGADKARLDGIRKKIEFAEKRKRNMETSAMNLATDQATKHQSDVITSDVAVKKAQRTVDELKQKMSGYSETDIHAKKQKEECEKKADEINDKIDEATKRSWVWNAEDGICPHCGQSLPAADVERIKHESEKRFNDRKADDLKALDEDFNKLQHTYTELKNLLEKTEEERKITTNQLVEAHKVLKEAEYHKLEVDTEVPDTYEQILAKKEEYHKVVKELADLQDELDKPSETSSEETAKMLSELEKEREPIGIRYNEVLELLATKETFDRISTRIEDINKDKETYQNQLDELDEELEIANEYNQKSCQLLEDRVNGHFDYVKWSLFKTTLDGEKKPFCECYHIGVPYSRLNTAAKVNAGIDIAYTFARYNEISVPMLLDECESVNRPLYHGGQQIRLNVTTDDELKFEYPSLAVME